MNRIVIVGDRQNNSEFQFSHSGSISTAILCLFGDRIELELKEN